MTDAIRFQAQIVKVQTLADGGIRLTFDLAETAIETATAMMQAKQAGAMLELAAVPIDAMKATQNDRKIHI